MFIDAQLNALVIIYVAADEADANTVCAGLNDSLRKGTNMVAAKARLT